MKHFVIYRKLILIIGTATAVVSVGVFFFMEDILFRTLFISFAFVFFGGLLFLLDFLHNRYNDNRIVISYNRKGLTAFAVFLLQRVIMSVSGRYIGIKRIMTR